MSEPPTSDAAELGPAAADSSAIATDGRTPSAGRFEGVTGIVGIRPFEQATDPLVGRTIGDVTLVAVLAEGGMGRVYEGRQRSPDRAVAVKVLRPGFITAEGVKRFAREAEVLGSLRHPNIAQVFWAGACDILGSAVPFIVMELVPGAVPITDYARDRRLDTPARLGLFRQVCGAVAHGHAAGVVHRDIKPGNVLVDSSGDAKLIDFGIARLAEESGDSTALTELGRIVGTVQYMSPEQISGDAAAVDRRTDVYALGLLLHELVTGRRPYEIDSRRVFDAVRIIRGRKPISLAVADGRRPARNLERVVEKCLSLDPATRYADAVAVASAIDASGSDLPADAPRAPVLRRATLSIAVAITVVVAALASWLPARRSHTDAVLNPGASAAGATSPPVVASAISAVTDSAKPPSTPPQPVVARTLTVAEVTAAVPVNGILTFHNVSEIPLEVAEVLVGRGQRPRIYDLAEIGPQLAEILGRNRRGVELLGVRAVTPDVAARLVKTRGPLCLDRIERLDVATAKVLASHGDWLNIVGLQELSDDVLAELIAHRGYGMAIRVPGTLDYRRAEIIAHHRGTLYLVGLDKVDADAARALAGHRGPIHIDAAHLTPEVDRLLGEIE